MTEINYPGPYELRIDYTPYFGSGNVFGRQQRLNVDIVEPANQALTFDQYNFRDIDGVTSNALDDLVEDWLTLQNALFNNGTTIDGVELWKYPTAQSTDAVFWAAYQPTANLGTSASDSLDAGQNILSFTSQEGGTMKVIQMESILQPGQPVGRANLVAAVEAVVDFVLNGDGVNYGAPFLARDTSYPIKFNKMFPGVNEAAWKKRFGRR